MASSRPQVKQLYDVSCRHLCVGFAMVFYDIDPVNPVVMEVKTLSTRRPSRNPTVPQLHVCQLEYTVVLPVMTGLSIQRSVK